MPDLTTSDVVRLAELEIEMLTYLKCTEKIDCGVMCEKCRKRFLPLLSEYLTIAYLDE